MKSYRYDPGYHLELSARAQLLGVREGDTDETQSLLHGFVEQVASGAGVESETLDLVAWLIGRVLDGADPALVFAAPAGEKGGGMSARQHLQRRRERMILEYSIGGGAVWVFRGAGQGVTTRNSHHYSEELQRCHAPREACNAPRSVIHPESEGLV